MSLQVWLPLVNGSVVNQGVSDLNFTNTSSSNTSSNSNGKIGSCFYNNSYTTGGLVSDKTLYLGNTQSMFCWVKFESLMSNSSLGGAMCGQHRYPSNTGMGLTIKYISSTTGYLSINTGNGSGRTYNAYCGGTLLSSGNWYHVGFTYDGNIVKLYVNGSLDGTHTIGSQSNPADYVQIFTWSFGSTSGSGLHGNYKLLGYLNDVRIYDHCLSAKEVKDISKGLVAHFPLNQPERGPNLVVGSNAYSLSSPLTRTASKTDDYIHTSMTVTLTAGTVYNCSFYTTGAYNNIEFGLMYNNGYSYYKFMSSGYHTKLRDGLYYHSESFTVNQTGSYNIRLDWNISGETHSFWGIKIELGNVATPWCPHTSDSPTWSDNIEYDCSGYGNNGTVINSISLVSNSPRNKFCYDMSNGEILTPLTTTTFTQLTYACWVKLSSYTSDRCCLCIGGTYITVDEGGKLSSYAYGRNPAGYHSGSVTIPLNTWTHVAVVWDDNYVCGYVNGVLDYKVACTGAFTSTTANSIGKEHNYGRQMKGYLSDFRIYATALSESDVKELYNTPITVTKSGTLTTRGEFIEE